MLPKICPFLRKLGCQTHQHGTSGSKACLPRTFSYLHRSRLYHQDLEKRAKEKDAVS